MDDNNDSMEASKYRAPDSVIDVYRELDCLDGSQHDTELVHVTDHAQLRFLERVNPTEAYPRSTIEREFHEAEPVELNDPDIAESTRMHPKSGVVYVFDRDEGVILTCFIPTGEQLGNEPARTRRGAA